MASVSCSNTQSQAVQTAVSLSSIRFSYASSQSDFLCTDWQLPKNEKIFLYGASGSGKSTFLNILSGILSPQHGEVKILDTQLGQLSQSQRDRFRAQNIGIVFQQFNLIPYLTVWENLKLAVYFAKPLHMSSQKTSQHVLANVTSMMDMLKLDQALLAQLASQLSVGQRQRVAIMRAFINSPKLLLVDEPTSSLDSAARDGFMKMLMSLCQSNHTSLLFVSHDEGLRDHFSHHAAISDIANWSAKGSV